MTVKFPLAAFAEAAKAIRNVPGSSREIDILDHARLHAKKKRMTLTMSDTDMEACVTLDCEVDGEVLAAIPRAVLEFFIARSGDEPGTLDFDEDMRACVARHGKGRLTMPILPGPDFYLIEAGKPDWSMKLRANELCEALKRCEKALGTDASRFMLHGPFLHQRDGIRLIGSDSNRIHIVELNEPDFSGALPVRADIMPGVILPPKTVKEILRIFSGDESEVTVSGTDRIVIVEAERIKITSKLIDAAYVDYPRMIPARVDAHVTVQAEALTRALDALLVAPKSDGKGKREAVRTVRMTLREKAVDLYARGDTGEAEDSVEAVNEGVPDGTTLTFAAHFLRDVIDAAGAARISIHPPAEFALPFHIAGGEGAEFIIGQRRM